MANGKIVQLKELDDLATPIYPATKANAIYLENGSLLTDYLRGFPQTTIGAANQPIYLNNGVLTAGNEVYSKQEIDNLIKRNYASYHYVGSSLTLTAGVEWQQNISFTASGKRPVFVCASICNDGSASGSWITLAIKRDGAVLVSQTNVNSGSDNNNPGALVYLDNPSAGAHTYSIAAKIGSGDNISISESNSTYGAYEGPNLVVFEI